MTTAPPNLKAVRALLLAHLGNHGLGPAEVGIVGDANHRGGYHCGRDRVSLNDYSVRESSRDRNGLCDYASAIDIGQFDAGNGHDLRHFSRWLVARCKADDPDTRDIREVIYSPDGKVVKRWDRLGIRSSGDSSHLWHTHISYFRDATKSGRDLTPIYRRYLTTIGILEDDVSAAEVWDKTKWPGADGKTLYSAGSWLRNANKYAAEAREAAREACAKVDALAARIGAPAPVTVDAAAVAAALAKDAAFVAAIARAVNDDAAKRMAE